MFGSQTPIGFCHSHAHIRKLLPPFFLIYTTGLTLATQPGGHGVITPMDCSLSNSDFTISASGSGTGRAAQNLSVALGFNFIEAFTPLIAGRYVTCWSAVFMWWVVKAASDIRSHPKRPNVLSDSNTIRRTGTNLLSVSITVDQIPKQFSSWPSYATGPAL